MPPEKKYTRRFGVAEEVESNYQGQSGGSGNEEVRRELLCKYQAAIDVAKLIIEKNVVHSNPNMNA